MFNVPCVLEEATLDELAVYSWVELPKKPLKIQTPSFSPFLVVKDVKSKFQNSYLVTSTSVYL